jgi:hypothetical protein
VRREHYSRYLHRAQLRRSDTRVFLSAMHLQIAFATIFDTCSFMDSPESSVTPKIFILYFGAIVFLQDTKWFDSPQYGCSG